MSNEPKADLAGVDELVGRLRQPNECERWLFSVPFEAADMLQSLIATAREAEALRAENARLRGRLAHAEDDCEDDCIYCEERRQEIARAKENSRGTD